MMQYVIILHYAILSYIVLQYAMYVYIDLYDIIGQLTLLPRAAEFAEMMLPVEPNTMIVFLTDQYDHSFAPSGGVEGLILQCFFLDRPLHFTFSGLGDGGAAELLPDLQREPTGDIIVLYIYIYIYIH